MFLEIARTISKRSTCHRLNVGSVIVKDNRVISIGYNGPASGQPHCKGNACELTKKGGCARSIHAEANALAFIKSEYEGRSMSDDQLSVYITHSPCFDCARELIAFGIKKVYYEVPYRNTAPIKEMTDAGIEVYQYSPSGYIVDCKTNLIMEDQ